jgi:hypothetical protein
MAEITLRHYFQLSLSTISFSPHAAAASRALPLSMRIGFFAMPITFIRLTPLQKSRMSLRFH